MGICSKVLDTRTCTLSPLPLYTFRLFSALCCENVTPNFYQHQISRKKLKSTNSEKQKLLKFISDGLVSCVFEQLLTLYGRKNRQNHKTFLTVVFHFVHDTWQLNIYCKENQSF